MASKKIQNLLRQGKVTEAINLLARAARQRPNDARIWLELASQYGQAGHYPGVIAACSQVLRVQPGNATAYSLSGSAKASIGHLGEAEQDLRQAVILAPDDAGIINNLGSLLHLQDKNSEAIPLLERVVQMRPDNVNAIFNLATALTSCGRFKEAVAYYEKAIYAKPDFYECYIRLANISMNIGDYTQARSLFEQVLASAPDHPGAISGMATLLTREGGYEESYRLVRKLINNNTLLPSTIETYGELARRYDVQADAITVAERYLDDPTLHYMDKSKVCFTLGKLYDGNQEYDAAFKYYALANRYAPQEFSPKEHSDYIGRIIAAFNHEDMRSLPRAKRKYETPIFIVGMPRSGTSLVEQMLSCHPDVHAGGELLYMVSLVNSLPGITGIKSRFPEINKALKQEHIDTLTRNYQEQLTKLSSTARRITDKLPSNYLHLGLIARIYPHAKIINCLRDPRDSALSIFFQNFQSLQPFATDLGHIAHYYKSYRRLMDHWDAVLGMPILHLRYEELVENFEDKARSVVDFCGLEWDDRCLKFHESSRVVKTASYAQVRRPIYKKSVARWKHYEKHLSPLYEVLGPDLVDDVADTPNY